MSDKKYFVNMIHVFVAIHKEKERESERDSAKITSSFGVK